jgi:hypothetical protein
VGDVDRLLIEVHVFPSQAQDLSSSHSGLQSYDYDRSEVSASTNENGEKSFLLLVTQITLTRRRFA